ncbi:MAG: glycoside hydrolase family 3 N-terminal domain-containing protein [Pyrinomonadaceae bacterium]
MIETLRSLSLEQKIGQLFFIGIPGPVADAETRDLLYEISAGGVCLFSRNIRERTQTRELLNDIRELLLAPLLSVDQEGGLVDRLRRIMTPMPAAGSIRNAAEAAKLGVLISETLRILGFNMDFAPVVDVIDPERAIFFNGLLSRGFGSSAEEATQFGGDFMRALQSGGIIGCLKHFPGLGAARVDSHEELPTVDISNTELMSVDLSPYRELIARGDVHAVMAAHASFPNLNLQETDRNGKLLPSSLSYSFITTLLRGELALRGLVITDDLEMGAIINNYGIGEACKMAINAGADMLAICAEPANIRGGFQAVVNAVKAGEISPERVDESLERIAGVKGKLSLPLNFDNARLDALSDEIARFTEQISRH